MILILRINSCFVDTFREDLYTYDILTNYTLELYSGILLLESFIYTGF